MRSVCFASIVILTAMISFPAGAQNMGKNAEQIRSKWENAHNSRNAKEVAALYSEDAVLLIPNEAHIKGRSAIESLINSQIQEFGLSDLQITTDETQEVGDALLQSGTYTMKAKGPKGTMPVSGDWVTLLKKDADGNWRISRHIWNEDAPEASPQ
jgi:uncharacterized protein (TIGR02246 family)